MGRIKANGDQAQISRINGCSIYFPPRKNPVENVREMVYSGYIPLLGWGIRQIDGPEI